MKPRILIVDDEEDIRKSLRMILEYEGYACFAAGTPEEGLEAARREDPDVILLDIKMPGMDGLEVLGRLKERGDRGEVVMISGHATVATAVEATRKGAFDFLEKPLEEGRVLTSVRNALQQRRLSEENRELKQEKGTRYEMIGESPAIQGVWTAVAKAAPTNATVLLTGESGTGKELVAWQVCRLSQRRDRPFVKVNCAAIPEELIESELFGHEKGAFTGAVARQTGKFVQADGGTIFLDEIADMSLKTQSKVLRVLEEGEIQRVGSSRVGKVDVRVIAATNKDLKEEIGEGKFRDDLYFRLNVVPVYSPALREKKEDIPLLIDYFSRNFAEENNRKPKKFSPEALALLMTYPWKGNVRELRNVVERLLIMTDAEVIDKKDLPEQVGGGAKAQLPDVAVAQTLKDYRELAEKDFILAKLEKNNWNISQTAREIDTPRSNLYKKLTQYGIKIKVGVGEAVAPSSPTEKKGEESPNSTGQDGR